MEFVGCFGPVCNEIRTSRAPDERLGEVDRELSPGGYGSKRVSEVDPALTPARRRGDNFPSPI